MYLSIANASMKVPVHACCHGDTVCCCAVILGYGYIILQDTLQVAKSKFHWAAHALHKDVLKFVQRCQYFREAGQPYRVVGLVDKLRGSCTWLPGGHSSSAFSTLAHRQRAG